MSSRPEINMLEQVLVWPEVQSWNADSQCTACYGQIHLPLIVPEVRLEPPQADLNRGQPRAACGNVAAVVCVVVCCIVHAPQQDLPRHQRCRRRRCPIPPPRIGYYPSVDFYRLPPAHPPRSKSCLVLIYREILEAGVLAFSLTEAACLEKDLAACHCRNSELGVVIRSGQR